MVKDALDNYESKARGLLLIANGSQPAKVSRLWPPGWTGQLVYLEQWLVLPNRVFYFLWGRCNLEGCTMRTLGCLYSRTRRLYMERHRTSTFSASIEWPVEERPGETYTESFKKTAWWWSLCKRLYDTPRRCVSWVRATDRLDSNSIFCVSWRSYAKCYKTGFDPFFDSVTKIWCAK